MDCFVKRFQPDRYDLWKIGKDVAPHPEDDQSKLYKHKYALWEASLIQMYLIIYYTSTSFENFHVAS